MNAKRKGSHNQHRTMAILEAAGYACTRSSASLGLGRYRHRELGRRPGADQVEGLAERGGDGRAPVVPVSAQLPALDSSLAGASEIAGREGTLSIGNPCESDGWFVELAL